MKKISDSNSHDCFFLLFTDFAMSNLYFANDEDRPPAPPVRVTSTAKMDAYPPGSKPLPSAPIESEGQKKKKIKMPWISRPNNDTCKLACTYLCRRYMLDDTCFYYKIDDAKELGNFCCVVLLYMNGGFERKRSWEWTRVSVVTSYCIIG